MNTIQNCGMQNFHLGFKGAKNNALKQQTKLSLAKKIIGDKYNNASSEIDILVSLFKHGQITAEKFIQKIRVLMGDKQALIAEAKEMVYNGEMTMEEYSKSITEILNTIA